MTSQIIVRPATSEDVAEILRLIRQLAAAERSPYSAMITEDIIRAEGFGVHRRFEVLLAELDGRICGATMVLQAYSNWNGAATLTIQDLFVDEEARRAGVGKALLNAVARIADDRGCCRIDVSVLSWNTPTRRFYEKLGFTHNDDWVPYRLDRNGLDKLIRGA